MDPLGIYIFFFISLLQAKLAAAETGDSLRLFTQTLATEISKYQTASKVIKGLMPKAKAKAKAAAAAPSI